MVYTATLLFGGFRTDPAYNTEQHSVLLYWVISAIQMEYLSFCLPKSLSALSWTPLLFNAKATELFLLTVLSSPSPTPPPSLPSFPSGSLAQSLSNPWSLLLQLPSAGMVTLAIQTALNFTSLASFPFSRFTYCRNFLPPNIVL